MSLSIDGSCTGERPRSFGIAGDERTWLAFSLTMVDGLSVEDAAQRLGMAVGSVYAARSRMVAKIA